MLRAWFDSIVPAGGSDHPLATSQTLWEPGEGVDAAEEPEPDLDGPPDTDDEVGGEVPIPETFSPPGEDGLLDLRVAFWTKALSGLMKSWKKGKGFLFLPTPHPIFWGGRPPTTSYFLRVPNWAQFFSVKEVFLKVAYWAVGWPPPPSPKPFRQFWGHFVLMCRFLPPAHPGMCRNPWGTLPARRGGGRTPLPRNRRGRENFGYCGPTKGRKMGQIC